MHRLTVDKPACEMSMVELAHNACYLKDGWAQYRDYERDIDIRELTRGLLKQYADGDDAFTRDNDFADYMIDILQLGLNDIEGLIAVFYRNMWAMADLRESLKEYEELEEQRRLLKLPCLIGDILYEPRPERGIITEYIVTGFSYCGNTIFAHWKLNSGIYNHLDGVTVNNIGMSVFTTQEEAEAILKKFTS